MKASCVYLVGAGPGDPDLMTIKGQRCISRADVIIYDRLVNKTLLAWAGTDCELIYAGKRKHLHAMSQQQINQLMINKAKAGYTVVRLKGGDPFVFGRGGEEIEALDKQNIAWEVIPGITAAAGAAASLGVPLTHRSHAQAVTFVTAHKQNGTLDLDWDLVMRPNQTVVFFMGFSVLDTLVQTLLNKGQPPETNFSLIADATGPRERKVHTTLAQVRDHPELPLLNSPVLLMMHPAPCVATRDLTQAETTRREPALVHRSAG